MKYAYFFNLPSKVPLTNSEVYEIFTKRIKPEELNKERVCLELKAPKGLTYTIPYSDGEVTFNVISDDSYTPITIFPNRTRNTHRVASKISRLLGLTEFGGLVQTEPQNETA